MYIFVMIAANTEQKQVNGIVFSIIIRLHGITNKDAADFWTEIWTLTTNKDKQPILLSICPDDEI